MIKISNAEISGFLNPMINSLVTDSTRKFPIAAAFQLADILKQIQDKAKIYQDCAQKIIKTYEGIMDDRGRVTYSSDVNRRSALQEFEKLNKIEVEIPGNKIIWDENWPEITIQEAFILKPIIR